MADFPTSIKSFTNPTSTNKLDSPSHSDQHADANDEITAIETALGTGLSNIYYLGGLDVKVADGGTGVSSFTANQVVLGGTGSTTGLQSVAVGTTGQPLLSAGAAVPAFGDLQVPAGGTGSTTFTAYSVICAGTGSTTGFQSVSAGTVGQALTYTGPTSLPDYATLTVPAGGTGAVTFTGNELIIAGTPGTAAFTQVATGTTGQALICGGTGIPAYGTLSVPGGGSGATSFTANQIVIAGTPGTAALTQVAVGTAAQALICGGTGIPSFGTLTVPGGGTGNTTFTANQVVLAGTGATTGFQSVVEGTAGQALLSNGASVPAFGNLAVPAGGTGATSFTANHLIIAGTPGTAALTQVAAGTVGQALVCGGTGVPSFGTLGVIGGGLGVATLTANMPVIAGTAATAAITQVAAGTAGQVLTCQGTAAPTFADPTYVLITGDPSTAANSSTGIKATFTAHDTVAFGDAVYMGTAGEMKLGKADAIATSSCFAMATMAIATDGSSGTFLLNGVVCNTAWSWTVGGLVYLSTAGTTTNTLTQTAPTATDSVTQVMGIATKAKVMYFNPQLVQVEHT